MAQFIAQSSTNMLRDDLLSFVTDGTVLLANATQLLVRQDDGDSIVAVGTFTYPAGGGLQLPSSGTITEISVTVAPDTRLFDGTQFNIDIDTAEAFFATNDVLGFVAYAMRGVDTVFGSTSGDTLLGFDGDDTINGNPGNDLVYGNAGADTVVGGSGADWVLGGQGSDIVLGGQGDDPFLNGNKGADFLFGNLGSDTIFGGQDADTIVGDDGNGSGLGGDDLLYGDLGDDVLYGDYFDDTLIGGQGADTFFFFSDEGVDVIEDFTPGQGDKIGIEVDINGTGVNSFATLLPRIVPDGAGGSVILLGDNNQVTVEGVAPGVFTASMFEFFV